MISSRAARFSGSNASISAAPNAANAIALGHGDRSCAARSNCMIADCRAQTTSLCAAAVPSPHTQRPQASSRLGSRSEEHTSELQSRLHLVCRLLLEKKKYNLNSSTLQKKTTKMKHYS